MVVFLKTVLLQNLQEPDTQPETSDARVQPEDEADRIEDVIDDLTFRSETEDGVDDAKVRDLDLQAWTASRVRVKERDRESWSQVSKQETQNEG